MTPERVNVTVKTEQSPGLLLLFLVFLVLKLTDVISWSWWWVTAPLWIPVALVLGIFVIGAIFIIFRELFRKR